MPTTSPPNRNAGASRRQHQRVEISGHLAAAALRSRKESGLIAWSIMRVSQPSPGANVVTRTTIRHVLRPYFKEPTIRQLIRDMMGDFLHEIPGDRFELHGQQRVARALGACRVNMYRTLVGVDHLRTRNDRRAVLFAAAIPVGTPISQLALTAMTGMSPGTIRRILKRGKHVNAERQFATLSRVIQTVPDECRAILARQGVTIRRGELVKHLPNVHHISHRRIRAGRRSRQLFVDLPRHEDANGARPRRYYESYTALRRKSGGTGLTDDVRDLVYVRWPQKRHGIQWEAA